MEVVAYFKVEYQEKTFCDVSVIRSKVVNVRGLYSINGL